MGIREEQTGNVVSGPAVIGEPWWLISKPEPSIAVMEGEYDDHFSAAELAAAARALFNATCGNCPHTPSCNDKDTCVRRYALTSRARRTA